MRRLVNSEIEKVLRRNEGSERVIDALMQETWRGHALLAAALSEDKVLCIRMQGEMCIPAFTSYESAEAFQQMLLRQNGPAVIMQEMPLENLMQAIIEREFCAAVDPGMEHCAILPAAVFMAIKRTTVRLTGGSMPGEDLPLMKLHMDTVGNGERAARSGQCGCFHCRQLFPASEINRFMAETDGLRTAVCPRCGIDAVLTELDGVPLTKEILETMNARFFGRMDEEDGVLRMMYMQCMRERIQEGRS